MQTLIQKTYKMQVNGPYTCSTCSTRLAVTYILKGENVIHLTVNPLVLLQILKQPQTQRGINV